MRFRLIALLLISISLFACSKTKVKPSADYLKTLEALSIIDDLGAAYQDKKASVFKKEFPGKADEIELQFSAFDKAELSFTTKWATIKDQKLSITVQWEGKWEHRGATAKRIGTAIFVFNENPVRLLSIEQDNPFIQFVVQKK